MRIATKIQTEKSLFRLAPYVPFVLLFFLLPTVLFAQQDESEDSGSRKFALVIGNSAYTGMNRLANPVNDAYGVAHALWELGFEVDMLLDAGLEEMEEAVTKFKNYLGEAKNTYGFFFYAGHGVQSGGENYLIPVNANIPGENYLGSRALQVQAVLDDLNDAGNSLNVVVLDACRDNPFSWGRSGSRGLVIVGRQPADSIIVYATSAGQTALDSDGEGGENGLFTSHLLRNLSIPDLEVYELFRRTSSDVSEASKRGQIPAIYSQFFGTAYLGSTPSVPLSRPVRPAPLPPPSISADKGQTDDRFWSVGASLGSSFAAPWLIGTVRGTVAPFRSSFLELGIDFGLVEGTADVKYYSLYPFVQYALFLPFEKAGWYIGAGGGLLSVSYNVPEGDWSENIFLAAFTTGINILDMIDISYTLRTNFSGVSNKLSVGYTYRFRRS